MRFMGVYLYNLLISSKISSVLRRYHSVVFVAGSLGSREPLQNWRPVERAPEGPFLSVCVVGWLYWTEFPGSDLINLWTRSQSHYIAHRALHNYFITELTCRLWGDLSTDVEVGRFIVPDMTQITASLINRTNPWLIPKSRFQNFVCIGRPVVAPIWVLAKTRSIGTYLRPPGYV